MKSLDQRNVRPMSVCPPPRNKKHAYPAYFILYYEETMVSYRINFIPKQDTMLIIGET